MGFNSLKIIKNYFIKYLLILIVIPAFYFLFPLTDVFAAGVEAKLNTNNGSNSLNVQDSDSVVVSEIDSDGNFVTKGCVRVDSGGTECTDAENLIVDGNIGIGTTAPVAILQVSGNEVHIGDAGTVNSATGDGDLYIESDLEVDGAVYGGTGGFTMGADLDMAGQAIESSTGAIYFDPDDDGANEIVMISSGNVGIGIAAPVGLLHVDGGDVKIGTGTFNNLSNDPDLYVTGNFEVDGNVWMGDNVTVDNITITGTLDQTGNSTQNGTLIVDETNVEALLIRKDADADDVFIVDTTNSIVKVEGVIPRLTIGDADAEDALLVYDGNAQDMYVGLDDTTDDLTIGTGTAVGTNAWMVVENAGNVGIGTTVPLGLLHVEDGDVRIGLGNFNNLSDDEDLYVTGNIEVDGNVWMGDAVADNLTITGTLTQTGDSVQNGTFTVDDSDAEALLIRRDGDAKDVFIVDTTDAELEVYDELGIGVTPTSELHVGGTTPQITIGDAGAEDTSIVYDGNAQDMYIGLDDTTDDLTFGTGAAVGTNPWMVIENAGNVGIGTTLPLGLLQVKGGDVKIGLGTFNNLSNDEDLYVTGNLEVDGNVWLGDNVTVDDITITGTLTQTGDVTFDGALTIDDDDVEALLVRRNGDAKDILLTDTTNAEVEIYDELGIGITPTSELHVAGTTPQITIGDADEEDSILVYDGNGQDFYVALDDTTDDLTIGTGQTIGTNLIMVIENNGEVGIGEVSPDANLEIVEAGTTPFMVSNGASGDGDFMIVTTLGNVGIGTTVPTGLLHVENGDLRVGLGTFHNPSNDEDLYVTGNFEVDGNVWMGDAIVDNITITGQMSQTGDVRYDGTVTIDDNDTEALLIRQNGDADDVFIVDTQNSIIKIEGVTPQLTIGDADAEDTLIVYDGNAQDMYIGLDDTTDDLTFGTGAAVGTNPWMVIENAGNVGIGTTLPLGLLQVKGGDVKIGLGTFNNLSNDEDLYVTGNLEVDGNVWLGDNVTVDDITVTGTLSQTGDSIYDGKFTIDDTDVEAFLVRQDADADDVFVVDTANSVVKIEGVVPQVTIGDADEEDAQLVFDGNAQDMHIGLDDTTDDLTFGTGTALGTNPWMVIENAGNVGIGTTIPLGLLQVKGGDTKLGLGTFNNLSDDEDLYVTGNLEVDGNVWLGDAVVDDITITGTFSQTGDLTFDGKLLIDDTDDEALLVRRDGDTKDVLIADTTNAEVEIYDELGIGITPTSELHVAGTTPQITIGDAGAEDTIILYDGNSQDFYMALDDTADDLIIGSGATIGNSVRMTIENNGNVGIGEAGPDATLEVVEAGTTPLMISDGVDGNGDFVIVTTAGNVGINDTTPSEKLDITGDIRISSDGHIGQYFYHDGDDDTYLRYQLDDVEISIGGETLVDINEGAQDIVKLGDGGDVDINLNDMAMVEGSSGNTGIGDATPEATLEVVEAGTIPFMVSNGANGDGDFVIIQTNGNVGIGTTLPLGLLQTKGGDVKLGLGTFNNVSNDEDLYVTGNLEVDGNVWLGDAVADDFTVTGSFAQTGNVSFDGQLIVDETNVEALLVRQNADADDVFIVDTTNSIVKVEGVTPQITIGDADAEDTLIVYDGNAQDFYIGLDDTTDDLTFGLGGSVGTNAKMVLENTGNVGLGEVEPDATLEIVEAGTVPFMISNGAGGDGDFVKVTTAGNVGIGTITPVALLHVEDGDVRLGSGTFDNASASEDMYITGNLEVDGDVSFTGGGLQDGAVIIDVDAVEALLVRKDGDGGDILIADTTNVEVEIYDELGIGITPTSELHVAGTTPQITIGDAGAEDTSIVFDGNAQDMYIGLDDTTDDLTIGTGAAVGTNPWMVIENDGSIGIGTVTPTGLVHIDNGDVRIGSGTFDNLTDDEDLYVTGNLEVDGNVWLGDAAADSLTVTGTFSQTGDMVFDGKVTLDDTDTEAFLIRQDGDADDIFIVDTTNSDVKVEGVVPELVIGDGDAEDTILTYNGNTQDFYIALDDSADDLLIGTGGAVGTNARMTIRNAGNVGIGTTVVDALLVVGNGGSLDNVAAGDAYIKNDLEIDGNLYVTGTINQTNNADFDGKVTIDVTDTEALLVRKNGDGGDILVVDSTNSQIEVYSQVGIGKTPAAGSELDVSGDADISATLDVGTNATVGGTLGVTGQATISGGISADNFSVANTSGNTAVGGTLGVTGATTLSSTLGVTGVATVASNSALNGGITVDGTNFTVNGGTGAVSTASTLQVAGATTLSTTLGVTGVATVASNSALNGGITVDGTNFTVNGGTGAMSTASTITAAGNSALNGGITVDGTNFTVNGASGAMSTASTITAAGNSALNGGITVDGTNFVVNGTNGNVSNAGTLTVAGATALSSTLSVTADTRVGGGTFNNASGSSDMYVTGNLEVDGNVYLGDLVTDSIVITGAMTNTGDLNMSGYKITNIGDTGTDFDDSGGLTLAGTLDAAGLTTLTGGISADNFSVANTSGNTAVGGTLGVTGVSTLAGLLNANGGIAVDTNKFTVADGSGNTVIAGTLGVTGATTLSSTLGVTGQATISGGISADNFSVANTSGNTAVGGTLGVTGVSTLAGLLNANGGIAVDTNKFTVADGSGNTVIAGTLGVTGATTLSSTLGVTGQATISGGISADNFSVANTSGNTAVGGTLGVTGVSTLAGLLNANGGIAVDTNKFTVADGSGNTVIAGTLGVTGATTLSSTLAVTGVTNHSNDIEMNTNVLTEIGTGNSYFTANGGLVLETGNLVVGGTHMNFNTTAGCVSWDGTNSFYLRSGGTGGTNRLQVDGSSGIIYMPYGINVDGGNFTVADGSGNTAIGGTLGVTGVSTLAALVNANGGIAVDTNKFTVADGSGNTVIAGTLGVTGATTLSSTLAVQTDKLVVDGSGNTQVGGKFTVQPGSPAKFMVSAAGATTVGTTLGVTGATTLSDTLYVGDNVTVVAGGQLNMQAGGSTIVNIGAAGTDFTAGGGLNLAEDLNIGSSKFTVDAATGNITAAAGLTVVNSVTTSSNYYLGGPTIQHTNGGQHVVGAGQNLDFKDGATLNVSINGGTGRLYANYGMDVTGTLNVSSDLKVATNKFVVAAASGNTTVAGTLLVSGAATMQGVTVQTLDTGYGANDLFDMDQHVLQASAVTFATVDTGQGAQELYGMAKDLLSTAPITIAGGGNDTLYGPDGDITIAITADAVGDTQLAYNTGQHLTTTSAVTFATVNTGQGAQELYGMAKDLLSGSSITVTGGGNNTLYGPDGDITVAVTNDSITDTQLAYNTGQHLTTASGVTFTTVNTGQGAQELYGMAKDLLSGSSITVTGGGNNTLYGPDGDITIAVTGNSITDTQLAYDTGQHLKTSSNVTFNQVTSGAYYHSSDRRLKENISRINNAMDKVRLIEGVYFDWKKDGRPGMGFIAQDLEKIFPRLVSQDERTGLKAIEYNELSAVLLEALKEQEDVFTQKINALTQKMEKMQSEIEDLRDF